MRALRAKTCLNFADKQINFIVVKIYVSLTESYNDRSNTEVEQSVKSRVSLTGWIATVTWTDISQMFGEIS